jgi:hypothetical protein
MYVYLNCAHAQFQAMGLSDCKHKINTSDGFVLNQYHSIFSRFFSNRCNALGFSDIAPQSIFSGYMSNIFKQFLLKLRVTQSIFSIFFSNKCMAFGFSDNNFKILFQFGGTMDAREVFKMSMGKLLTDRLVRGINPEGVFDWLEYARVHWSVEINGTWCQVSSAELASMYCWVRLCERILYIAICS